MKRSQPLRRSKTAKRSDRTADPKKGLRKAQNAAHEWWVAVVQGKPCVNCGTRRDVQGHHVIPRNALKRECPRGAAGYTLQELLWSTANGIPLCEVCHFRHESGFARIEARLLPIDAIKLAVLIGMEHRIGPRYYPRSSQSNAAACG